MDEKVPEWVAAGNRHVHMRPDESWFWYWSWHGAPPESVFCLGCNHPEMEQRVMPGHNLGPNDTVILENDECICPHHGFLGATA